jgi:prepilin-type N-terminal cleavage/methylation domain-containing protein
MTGMNSKGITLLELLITVSIVGLLAAIAIPGYIGQQRRAARTEAYTNLENIRLLEEQFYAENGRYTVNLGTCAKDNPGNVAQIQQGGAAPDPNNDLPGFRPGNSTMFSYCIEQDMNMNGVGVSNCYRVRAFGNTGTRVDLDVFSVDCNNNRNF